MRANRSPAGSPGYNGFQSSPKLKHGAPWGCQLLGPGALAGPDKRGSLVRSTVARSTSREKECGLHLTETEDRDLVRLGESLHRNPWLLGNFDASEAKIQVKSRNSLESGAIIQNPAIPIASHLCNFAIFHSILLFILHHAVLPISRRSCRCRSGTECRHRISDRRPEALARKQCHCAGPAPCTFSKSSLFIFTIHLLTPLPELFDRI